jgi:hypothetical protein
LLLVWLGCGLALVFFAHGGFPFANSRLPRRHSSPQRAVSAATRDKRRSCCWSMWDLGRTRKIRFGFGERRSKITDGSPRGCPSFRRKTWRRLIAGQPYGAQLYSVQAGCSLSG